MQSQGTRGWVAAQCNAAVPPNECDAKQKRPPGSRSRIRLGDRADIPGQLVDSEMAGRGNGIILPGRRLIHPRRAARTAMAARIKGIKAAMFRKTFEKRPVAAGAKALAWAQSRMGPSDLAE